MTRGRCLTTTNINQFIVCTFTARDIENCVFKHMYTRTQLSFTEVVFANNAMLTFHIKMYSNCLQQVFNLKYQSTFKVNPVKVGLVYD